MSTTCLSILTEHDWQVLRNRWARGIEWNVEKRGRRWALPFGGFKPFKTKTAAYNAGAEVVCREAAIRAGCA